MRSSDPSQGEGEDATGQDQLISVRHDARGHPIPRLQGLGCRALAHQHRFAAPDLIARPQRLTGGEIADLVELMTEVCSAVMYRRAAADSFQPRRWR